MEPEQMEGVTLGELFRGLGRTEKAVETGFAAMNERIDQMRAEFVPAVLYQSERDAMLERIKAQEDNRKFNASTRVSVICAAAAVASACASIFHLIH